MTASAAPHGARGDLERSLVAPALEIFDAGVVTDGFKEAAKNKGLAKKRLAAVAILKEAHARGFARIEQAFYERDADGVRTARSIAWLTDQLVCAAFTYATEHLFPLPNPTRSEHVAVVAVGGYGRGEMAPYSDVDLLFLTPYKKTGWTESVIEATLYILWDLKLKVGHSTRNVDDCIRLGGQDLTIRTALLERRFLVGHTGLAEELDVRLWSELFVRTGPEFVRAKLEERDARHIRMGDSRYMLEPNVKESKGGLRDLQTLFWIAKYLYRADNLDQLVEKGVFLEEEAVRFRMAERMLWTVRCGVHYLSGRAQDKLTFDIQVDLAQRMKYRDTLGRRAVERFMTRYFLAAKHVGDLTGIFSAALEAQNQKSPPLLNNVMRMFSSETPVNNGGYEWLSEKDGRLTVVDPSFLEKDPANIFRMIRVATRTGVTLHPQTLRYVYKMRRHIDAVRDDPDGQRLFIDLISSSMDPGAALRYMFETGVLGRFLPDFRRITGLMQFNMYHSYTVDEHTIRAIETLHQMAAGDLVDEHPEETQILRGGADRRILSVALLLHDIGKGEPEDHSVLGARIAKEVCPALGMSQAETELISWLVREHLSMSDTAQKRDVSDAATIRDFAKLVRSPERLRLLYVLTACDIRAVGPNVWNGWKAQLLRQLYNETRFALTGQDEGRTRSDRVAQAQAALRAHAPNLSDKQWTDYTERFFSSYWLGVSENTHARHLKLITAPSKEDLRMCAHISETYGATEISFFTSDHPRVFSRMAGAFALAGASVIDARAYTTRDGMTVNTFWVQDSEGAPFEMSRVKRLKTYVDRTLRGEVIAADALRTHGKLKRREEPFEVTPSVVFDDSASDAFTVVEVSARDRTGLLFELTRTLADENINIFSATITTFGEHAVDVFYVRDLFGGKVRDAAKQAQIRKALLEAVERVTGGA